MKELIYQSSGAMVTQLDPDAPTRQSRSIHDLDQVYPYLLQHSLLLQLVVTR